MSLSSHISTLTFLILVSTFFILEFLINAFTQSVFPIHCSIIWIMNSTGQFCSL